MVKNITYYIVGRHLHNMLYSTLYNELYCRLILQYNNKQTNKKYGIQDIGQLNMIKKLMLQNYMTSDTFINSRYFTWFVTNVL